MYKINSSSQKILEKMLGKKYREIVDMDYDDEISYIQKKNNRKLVFSNPAGNYSGMDQYASAYVCMDEPAVGQWYHQPFAWITGDFPGDNDVYGLFRSGWSGL